MAFDTTSETGRRRSVVERLMAGDRLALASAITAVENATPAGAEVLDALRGREPRRARRLGITGPPGAGKSTLVGALVTELLSQGRTIGVLLVDPSSPISGGAVLADRIRLRRTASRDLYVRSVASRGLAGGVTRATAELLQLLEAWGADVVIVETVGAGQGDVEVCRLVDHTVVVCPPGLGDELQAMKAGLMEIADVFVVNKADRPGAGETAASLADSGPGGRLHKARPVVSTIATTAQGVPDLLDTLRRLEDERASSGENAELDRAHVRRDLAARAGALVRDLVLGSTTDAMEAIVTDLRDHRIDGEAAAWSALRSVVRS